MKAAVLSPDRKLALKDVPTPDLARRLIPKKYGQGFIEVRPEEQVLLKVEAVGICGSDLHALEGSHPCCPPVILGHEYVGTVVKVGEAVKHLREGDRVAVDPNIKCGLCPFCRRGQPNLCQGFTTLGMFADGGLAEYSVAPARQLLPIGDLEAERAVFLEPLSCVLHGLDKVKPSVTDSALIFGGGPVGCYFTMLCKAAGVSQITVVEPSPYRKPFAEAAGAQAVIDPGQEREFQAAHVPLGFDVVIDGSGRPEIVPLAIDLARRGGRLLLFGQQSAGARVAICPATANEKELQIFGSYATANVFPQTIELLHNRQLPLERLITHRLPLAEVRSAFDLMASARCLKVLVFP